MFERAVELDSTYSQAFYGLAYSHHRDLLLEFARSRDDSVARCLAAAERAVALDAMDSLAHSMLGYAALWAGQHDRATVEGEKAVELNPSNPVAYALLGNALDFTGRPEEAITIVEIGRRLNPNDPRDHIYLTLLARTHLDAGHYEEAAMRARKAIHVRSHYPDAVVVLASSLGHLGRQAEARSVLDEWGPLQVATIQNQASWRRYKNPADLEHLLDGLRKAGVPE
jgi:adenylate cyclase